jgi:hypothetical protein
MYSLSNPRLPFQLGNTHEALTSSHTIEGSDWSVTCLRIGRGSGDKHSRLVVCATPRLQWSRVGENRQARRNHMAARKTLGLIEPLGPFAPTQLAGLLLNCRSISRGASHGWWMRRKVKVPTTDYRCGTDPFARDRSAVSEDPHTIPNDRLPCPSSTQGDC